MEEKKKLLGVEKFAYGIGAVGKDMVYMLSASYILYYYQDIMGVSAWAMGIILLVARVFDAFNDPIMGMMVAKTKSKWGKFRPWLFLGTLTNAILLVIMFSAPPGLNSKGLVAYAAITYILWGITYTMMDIPYWSMVPAFTEGGKERENLSALARSCAGIGSALVTIITVMAVTILGGMFTSNSKSKETVDYTSVDQEVTVYVVEEKGENNPTGNVLTYDNSKEIKISVTANKEFFRSDLSIKDDNSKYSIKIGEKKFDGDNSKVSFAQDIENEEAVLVLYLQKKEYDSLVESNNILAEFTSTNEVERLGYKYFAVIIAILFFVFISITCIFIKEKSTVDVQTPSVCDMIKALIQNDQAMVMVITIVLVNSATYITSNLLIYFFKYDLAGGNWQENYTLFNSFGGGVQILAMMLFFPVLRKIYDTIRIFYICIVSAVVGYIILLIMALGKTSTVYPFFIPGFFIMSAVGMLNVLVTIFLANTVDYGEYKNGRRDESVIFSMQTFVVKLASGVAVLVASICLSVFKISKKKDIKLTVNYLNSTVSKIKSNVVDQISNSSVIGLRLTMTLIPVIVLVIAVLIFKKKYILTDNKLEKISVSLKNKNEN